MVQLAEKRVHQLFAMKMYEFGVFVEKLFFFCIFTKRFRILYDCRVVNMEVCAYQWVTMFNGEFNILEKYNYRKSLTIFDIFRRVEQFYQSKLTSFFFRLLENKKIVSVQLDSLVAVVKSISMSVLRAHVIMVASVLICHKAIVANARQVIQAKIAKKKRVAVMLTHVQHVLCAKMNRAMVI